MGGEVGIFGRNQLRKPLQVLATPSTFVIDQSNKIIEGWIGPKKYEEIVQLLPSDLTRKD